jgi:hypothetical protein
MDICNLLGGRMKERVIRFDGHCFKQSEITAIIVELGIFGVCFDEEAKMVAYNYEDERHEELSDTFIAKFLFERRDAISLYKYNFKKCLSATKLVRIFMKKMRKDKADFLHEGDDIIGECLSEAKWENLK